jgi:hypothetical protein
MTQLSETLHAPTTPPGANCATGQVRSRVARPLHGGGVARSFVVALMLSACVIPPSLSVDTTDAGANAAPTILSVRADNLVELPDYSSVIFEKGVGQLNMTVQDTDVNDKLSCAAFVEYRPEDPTPPRATIDSAGNSVTRTCTLPLAGLCQNADIGASEPRLMSVIVFDRTVVPGEVPLYQAMSIGGLKATRTYFLTCVEQQQ